MSHLLVYLERENEGKPVLVDRVEAVTRTTSSLPAQQGQLYRVQAVSDRGVKSPFSEAVQVRIP